MPICTQAVTTTTGAVFDPVAASLKSIEGLEGLGEGVDTINGLSTTALQSVGETTKKAISLAGRVRRSAVSLIVGAHLTSSCSGTDVLRPRCRRHRECA